MLVVYILPIITSLKSKHTAIMNPEMAEILQKTSYSADVSYESPPRGTTETSDMHLVIMTKNM